VSGGNREQAPHRLADALCSEELGSVAISPGATLWTRDRRLAAADVVGVSLV
jgi:hypothetical protein